MIFSFAMKGLAAAGAGIRDQAEIRDQESPGPGIGRECDLAGGLPSLEKLTFVQVE
jgi:hypothetical protein